MINEKIIRKSHYTKSKMYERECEEYEGPKLPKFPIPKWMKKENK